MEKFIGKKEGRFYIIALIIVALLSFGAIGYLVYDEFIKEEPGENNEVNNEENNQNDEQNNNGENGLSAEKLNVLGLELFDMIDNRQAYSLPLFNTENILTYDSIMDNNKLTLAHKLIPDIEKTINEECTDRLSSCVREVISKSTMEKYYYKLFGSDKTVNHQFYTDFSNYLTCSYNNNEYECTMRIGGDVTDVVKYIKYDSTKEVDGDVIVTVKSLYVINEDGIYSDSTESNRIDNLDYYDNLMDSLSSDDYIDGINGINNSNYNNFINNLFARYDSNAGIYEVTFKKDTTDNYYWYSTKLM